MVGQVLPSWRCVGPSASSAAWRTLVRRSVEVVCVLALASCQTIAQPAGTFEVISLTPRPESVLALSNSRDQQGKFWYFRISMSFSVGLPTRTYNLSVDARSCAWQSTGIEIRRGNDVIVTARGTVVYWKSADGREKKTCGPNGVRGACDSPTEGCCLAPGLGNNALIGRIGTGEPFYIGEFAVIPAPSNGILYLAMNETAHCGGCADNEGSWTVSVQVRSSPWYYSFEYRLCPDDSNLASQCLWTGVPGDDLSGSGTRTYEGWLGCESNREAVAKETDLILTVRLVAHTTLVIDPAPPPQVVAERSFRFRTKRLDDPDRSPPQIDLSWRDARCVDGRGRVTFVWSASDDRTPTTQLQFRYRLDEGPWSSWQAGITTVTLQDLPRGSHVFLLQAKDSSGNVAEKRITVDVQCAEEDRNPPDLRLECARPGCAADGGRINFTWSATDDLSPGSAIRYRYRLDGAEWSDWAVESGKTYEKLNNGAHSFCVEARDAAGNTAQRCCDFSVQCQSPADLAVVDLRTAKRTVDLFTSLSDPKMMNWAVIGERTTVLIDLKLVSGQLPARGLKGMATVSLVDMPYPEGHNPISTFSVAVSGKGEVLPGSARDTEVVLDLGDVEALNAGRTVTITVAYTVGDWPDVPSGILADRLRVEIWMDAPGDDPANNSLEEDVLITQTTDAAIEGLVTTVATGLNLLSAREAVLGLAALGVNAAGAFVSICTRIAEGDYAGAGAETVALMISMVAYDAKLDPVGLITNIVDGGMGLAMAFFSGAKNAAIFIAYSANVVAKAMINFPGSVDRLAKLACKAFGASPRDRVLPIVLPILLGRGGSPTHAAALIGCGLFDLAEVISGGYFSVQEAIQAGLITAGNCAELIKAGVITVWEAIGSGLMNVWDAIRNGFCSVLDAVAHGVLKGTAILAIQQGPGTPAGVVGGAGQGSEFVVVDAFGRRSGVVQGRVLNEIGQSVVSLDGRGSVWIWLPEEVATYSLRVRSQTQGDVGLHLVFPDRVTAEWTRRLQYTLRLAAGSVAVATSEDLSRAGAVRVDRDGDGVFDEERTVESTCAYLVGDVDGDGRITLADLRLIQQAAVGMVFLDERARAAADIDGNGRVEFRDAEVLARWFAEGRSR